MQKETVDTKKEDSFTFGDPKEYAHLSTEEKKELTEKMKSKHKIWAGMGTPLGT